MNTSVRIVPSADTFVRNGARRAPFRTKVSDDGTIRTLATDAVEAKSFSLYLFQTKINFSPKGKIDFLTFFVFLVLHARTRYMYMVLATTSWPPSPGTYTRACSTYGSIRIHVVCECGSFLIVAPFGGPDQKRTRIHMTT